MGSIFGYKTEVVTHNKHTLKGAFVLTGTVSNERKNHVFHRDVLLLWNIFAVLNLKKELILRSDGEMVN